ncbi:MAG: hypothetical protein AB9861_00490 [Methanosarcina sp.]
MSDTYDYKNAGCRRDSRKDYLYNKETFTGSLLSSYPVSLIEMPWESIYDGYRSSA